MTKLLLILLVTLTSCKISVRVNKQLNLQDPLAEEVCTISAQNLNDFNVKRISFSFTDRVFKSLRIVKLMEGNTVIGTQSFFPENRFSFNFTTPKKPDESFAFKIIAYYFQPFEFIPYKLTISEDQKMEFKDNILNLVFGDDVKVEKVYGKYIVPIPIHSFNKEYVQNEVRNSQGGKELILKDIYPPFNDKEFKIHYTHDRPFEMLTKANKSIDVSMWGNLKFDYDFRIINKAAELDGELSNIDYMPQMSHSGRTSMRQNRVILPRDIWRLHLSDEVGNLTRSMASYKSSEEMELLIVPRFSLFGGNTHTYWISYNQWSKSYLFRSQENQNLFKLETSFTHILPALLTENYSMSFCLPEFSTLKSFDCPFPIKSQSITKSYGLFEYFGKDCYNYEFTNIAGKVHKTDVNIYFEYNTSYMYLKLLYVIGVMTVLFGFVFLVARIDLSFERLRKPKVE